MAFVHHCTTCHKQKLAAKVCNFCYLTKFPRIFCRFILIFPDYYVINMITRFPSSTILLHGLLRTLIQYTTNNLTNLWNHHIAPSSMNTQANVWNVKCHQDNDSIVVQHLVLFSILRASALSYVYALHHSHNRINCTVFLIF